MRKGPAITVRCDCGAIERLPYGERWSCTDCGRRWNTEQIPADEYWKLVRDMRRFRLSAMGAAVVIAAVFAVLALFVSQALFVLLPIVLAGWYMVYMPWWRRKVRARARSLPSWDLHPE